MVVKRKSPFAKSKTKNTQKSNPLFDQMRNLWTKDTLVTTKTKADSVYMITRFLSLTPEGFMPAQDLNRLHKLPEWAKLPFLYYSLPQQAAPWKKYPKVSKTKLTPKKQRALDRICTKFCVKEFHGLQIIQLLKMQGIEVEAD